MSNFWVNKRSGERRLVMFALGPALLIVLNVVGCVGDTEPGRLEQAIPNTPPGRASATLPPMGSGGVTPSGLVAPP